MVRSQRALEIVLEDVEVDPGLVLYTLVDHGLASVLEDFCTRRSLTCISVIDPFIKIMANYFGTTSRDLPGRQHELDEEYFERIEAINYVMQHDDGQQATNLEEADVVLVGVSRTSKTPTSIYLANRGIKASNIPIVPGQKLPDSLFASDCPLIVGLTEDPRRLVDIRRSRMRQSLGDTETAYTDIEEVKKEVKNARRLFGKHDWPVIDVTRRSIEETAAAIIRLVHERERRYGVGSDRQTVRSTQQNVHVVDPPALTRSGAPPLILASGSGTRAAMLKQAGLTFETMPAAVDEAAVKDSLRSEGATPEQIADTLAEMKALRIAHKTASVYPGALVLGADQVLDIDGEILDKPVDRNTAAAHLRRLSGSRHDLVSAAVILKNGERIWGRSDCASLVARPLSDKFIDTYLETIGDRALNSVGAYQLEGLGSHLFSGVYGDFFTILGLPLLPLLDFLRSHGTIMS